MFLSPSSRPDEWIYVFLCSIDVVFSILVSTHLNLWYVLASDGESMWESHRFEFCFIDLESNITAEDVHILTRWRNAWADVWISDLRHFLVPNWKTQPGHPTLHCTSRPATSMLAQIWETWLRRHIWKSWHGPERPYLEKTSPCSGLLYAQEHIVRVPLSCDSASTTDYSKAWFEQRGTLSWMVRSHRPDVCLQTSEYRLFSEHWIHSDTEVVGFVALLCLCWDLQDYTLSDFTSTNWCSEQEASPLSIQPTTIAGAISQLLWTSGCRNQNCFL
jgi:hypothetical protein